MYYDQVYHILSAIISIYTLYAKYKKKKMMR